MGFFSLLVVATTPVLEILIIGLVGAFLASSYCNILTPSALKDINKVVYVVFTPALIFASLAKTVTLQDIISWWYMPVNVGITFLIGGILGWVVVKVLRPERRLHGLVIASCSAGNLGNLLLIIIPAICEENGNPFGDSELCHERGLSYVALSMALGGIYIWTHTYSLMQKDSAVQEMSLNNAKHPYDCQQDQVVKIETGESYHDQKAAQDKNVPLLTGENPSRKKSHFLRKVKGTLHLLAEELTTPPIVAAIVGFIFGVIPWLKLLIFGDNAPLRVLQDSVQLLGNGLIPCITLILGGNLSKGLQKSGIKLSVMMSIIVMRFVVLPIAGIGVVRAASALGLLPHDPLFAYVLMIQFTLPPAMAIGTMAQLFDVGREECSVIFLWTYLVAALAVTVWSTVFMWILS